MHTPSQVHTDTCMLLLLGSNKDKCKSKNTLSQMHSARGKDILKYEREEKEKGKTKNGGGVKEKRESMQGEGQIREGWS